MKNVSLLRFIWAFVSQQRLIFLFILSASFVWALDQTVWPLLVQITIDILTRYQTDRMAAWPALQIPIFYGILLYLTVEIGWRAQGFLMAQVIPRTEARIRLAMFDHIQRHSPHYFNENFAGSLANKITDMTTQVSVILRLVLTLFIPGAIACIVAILLFARIQPLFAVLLALWMIAHTAISLLFSRKTGYYENIHGELRTTLLGKIVDSLTNNFAVNLFYRFSDETERIKKLQAEEQRSNSKAQRYVEWMRSTLGLAYLIGVFAINGVMISHWMQGQLTTGEAVQIFNTHWNICGIMWIAGLSLPNLFQAIGIARQALSVMRDPSDVVDVPNARPLRISKGEIIFENVSFQYRDTKLFERKDVVIHGGQKVGLVGYSGAGKSTFINLILRFYPIQKGRILIDGQDISLIPLESLRRQVALIPQDPLLFHRSLRENIQFGRPEATEEEVYQAAKQAHCDEFIRRLPHGYDSLVGERGTKLSGGERQRIAIARAILANAPILFLDEATSALDSITERCIQDSLKWLMLNRTTIVIAHRLSTLVGMDRILVFVQGKIVEDGTHQELLKREGHYARLWQMQAGGFIPDVADE